jgi:dTDP-4-amino-4,6-dideoxygalactose transaminase
MVTQTEKLAIEGGEPVRRGGFHGWPVVSERDEQALLEVLRSGRWGSHAGNKAREFEQRFAEFHQAKYAVTVANGTAALEVALRAAGIGFGDEVIVPPYTFIATASACLMVDAIPVFADIDPETYQIDPRSVEQRITPRTRAVIAVHIGGGPADMDGVLDVARRHGLRVIEDAAQAHGAAWHGRRVGALGDLGTFSFQSSKNLTAGEGGIVLTNSEELYDLAWSLANVGRIRQGAWYQHEILGWNYRLTEFQSALLLAQMERLPEQIARREENAAYLAAGLAEVPGLRPLRRDPRVTTHAWHLFIGRYDATVWDGIPRERFLQAWRAEGIPVSAGYTTPLHHLPVILREIARLEAIAAGGRQSYDGWIAAGRPHPSPDSRRGMCPVAERACYEEGFWFPQHILLGSRADMDAIIAAAHKLWRRREALRA